jgi:hypothetical protein
LTALRREEDPARGRHARKLAFLAGAVLACFAFVFPSGSPSDAHAKRPRGADLTVRSLAGTSVWKRARPGKPRLRKVDGGLGYYGRFSNPLPTRKNFFPIGVWGAYGMEPANIAKDKAVGLNTYVWFADTTTPGYIKQARNAGMWLIVNRSEGGSRIGSETFGRVLDDEMDMQQGSDACPRQINTIKASLPHDGRARYANYGKGVLIWGATGYGGHNDRTSACFVNAQDITSADVYWFSDRFETDHPQSGNAWGYGWNIRRLRMLDAKDGKRTPQWGFVEVTDAMGGGAPTPAEIRAAVWHMLIAGARGIIYFQHDFSAPCDTHHALRETGSACYGATITAVTALDAQIKSLATVLNSPFVTSRHSASRSVEHMVKWDGRHFYVFIAARTGGQASFSMPCLGNATATVLGERRRLRVNEGSFADGFADRNAVHTYRIDGGSSCRLS